MDYVNRIKMEAFLADRRPGMLSCQRLIGGASIWRDAIACSVLIRMYCMLVNVIGINSPRLLNRCNSITWEVIPMIQVLF